MKNIKRLARLLAVTLKYYYLNPRITDEVVRKWSKEVCERFGITVFCEGKIDSERFMILANHESYFDIPAIYRCCDKRLIWVAKEELFNVPFIGHALRDMGGVAVSKYDDLKSAKALLKLIKNLEIGGVVIFPQGTRKDKSEFHMGGIFLAKKKKLPIYPVRIEGSGDIIPVGKFVLHPGTVTVKIYERIDVDEYSEDEIKDIVVRYIYD